MTIRTIAPQGRYAVGIEVTLAALADMEQSKGKGIRGKDVHAALADLKGEDDE